jgi:hypothetical protein
LKRCDGKVCQVFKGDVMRIRGDEVLMTVSAGKGGDGRVLVTAWLGEEVTKKVFKNHGVSM